jgi:mono/diheme cytochrome c family protein
METTGSGAGDLAKNMKAKMPDFRDPSALKGQTDGELFYIIKNGKGEMEGEGARLKPDDTWNLVNYLRERTKP